MSSSSSSEEGSTAAPQDTTTGGDMDDDMVDSGEHIPPPPTRYTLKQAFYKAYSTTPPKHDNDMLLAEIPREDKTRLVDYYEYANNPSPHWDKYYTQYHAFEVIVFIKSTQRKHGMPLLTFLRTITSCQSDTQRTCRTCYRSNDNA